MMATALVLLGLFGAFLLYLKLNEKRMIYYPTPEMGWTPRNGGLAFEDLKLQCADGVTIHGWFIPAAEPSHGTVLFFHGNAGSISHRFEKIQILHGLHLNICIIDYHGYGQSQGKPSEETTYLDADTAYDWLTRLR